MQEEIGEWAALDHNSEMANVQVWLRHANIAGDEYAMPAREAGGTPILRSCKAILGVRL